MMLEQGCELRYASARFTHCPGQAQVFVRAHDYQELQRVLLKMEADHKERGNCPAIVEAPLDCREFSMASWYGAPWGLVFNLNCSPLSVARESRESIRGAIRQVAVSLFPKFVVVGHVPESYRTERGLRFARLVRLLMCYALTGEPLTSEEGRILEVYRPYAKVIDALWEEYRKLHG